MGTTSAEDRRGILRPREAEAHFSFERRQPSADLAPLVERYWTVSWDLRRRPPHAQETLPYPSVNMVVGTHRPGVHGVCTTRFVAQLEGRGWVVGIKFRPGGFRPFFDVPMVSLTDRELAVRDVFGSDGGALDDAVHDAPTQREQIAIVEAFLRGRKARPDASALEVGRIVDLAKADPSIAGASDLAERAGVGLRMLQRLFSDHVGVPPKWVIRRFRVQEAAERAASGKVVEWSVVAMDLGYCDQAHFIRDFKAQVGRTPTQYAAMCRRPVEAAGESREL